MDISLHVFLPAILANTCAVEFFLYTLQSQNISIPIGPNNASDYIEKDAQICFFVYGWRTEVKPLYEKLKTAMFARANYNIIEVSFHDVDQDIYIISIALTTMIGQKIGDLIVSVTKEGYPLENIEIIGHSWGAHIAGSAGPYVYKKTSRKFGKIIALDPAGPLFEWPFNLVGRHLEKTDANVVFVIHTVPNFYGYDGNLGTTDVYANNGGGPQPGCPKAFLGISSCSHTRSMYYYISAYKNPGSMLAAKCESYDSLIKGKCNETKRIDLGGNITISDEGTYYLKTNSSEPFVSLIPSN